jgi:hypothetical protein
MLMLCFISFVNHQYFSPIGLLLVGVIDNFALFGLNRGTRSVQFETNSIYGFVPSSIYLQEKQTLVFS